MLYNHKGVQVISNSNVYLEETSVGLNKALNFFIISEFDCTALSVKMRNLNGTDNEDFTLYTITGNVIETVNELTLLNVQKTVQSNIRIYKLNVKFSPIEFSYEDKTNVLLVNYTLNGQSNYVEVVLHGKASEQKDNLVVALQNFKKFITDDYYTAFLDSNYKEKKQDFVLLNRKRKEMLLELHELTGFQSSYRSLIAAIRYFGYGDLLTIKELWKASYDTTKPQYKQTDILNSIITSIDKTLVGYEKTNLMRLVYQINKEEVSTNPPYQDSDKFPYYINVLYNTDEILLKLHSLERILKAEFLGLNSHIVDISGEYQSIVGNELNYWIADAAIQSVLMTENLKQEITYSFDENVIKIKRQLVDIDAWAIEYDDNGTPDITDDIPNYKSGLVTSILQSKFFEVYRKFLAPESNTETIDLAKFYASDFAIIKLNIELDSSAFNRYQFALFKNDNQQPSLLSTIKSINLLNDSLLIGVKELGYYRLFVYLYDNYGGCVILSIPEKIQVVNQSSDFKIYRTSIASSTKKKTIDLMSTFPTVDTSKNPVVEPLDWETLNINTFDPSTSIFRAIAFNENNPDLDSTYTRLREFSGIQIQKLKNTPMQAYGYKYGTILVDIIGDQNLSGNRSFSLKQFSGHAPVAISGLYLPSIITPEKFISMLIAQANNAGGFYSKFTYVIEYFNDSDNILLPSKPMLRITAIELSNTIDKFYCTVQDDNNISSILGGIDAHAFFQLDSTVVTTFVESSTSDLYVKIGNKEYVSTNLLIDSIETAATEIYDLVKNDEPLIKCFVANIATNNKILVVSSKKDLIIRHDAIGYNIAITRGKPAYDLIEAPYGSDIRIAEPVYAFADDNVKMLNRDIVWKLKNSLTGEIIYTQHSAAFKGSMFKAGAYDLEMTSTDDYGINTKTRYGCFLVS